MQITEATESHIPELLALWTEFFDYHRDIDPYFTRSEDAHRHIEKRLREKIEGADSGVFVALEDGKVIGYSLFWIADTSPFIKERKYGFICDLAVTATHRGRSVGGDLLEETLAWFKAHRIRRITLFLVAGNKMGLAFWKRHGFEPSMLSMEKLLDVDEREQG
jgi:ribosomal protein S18 acetylase RimI-like enzyme